MGTNTSLVLADSGSKVGEEFVEEFSQLGPLSVIILNLGDSHL
jgi:hypothetical protein